MKLVKELNWFHVFCISSGAMISSGLFLLPGLAHLQTGAAVPVSYLLAGLFAVAGLLSQAELATAMPKAGGTYFYVTRSMGPGVGTAYGLITVLALVLKSSFALVGLGAVSQIALNYFQLNIDSRVITSFLCLIFIGINIFGVKEAIRMQLILVISIICLLIVYIIMGLTHIQIYRFEPFTKSVVSIFSTAGFVFVSYGGLLKVASMAEEVKDPGRSLPLGMSLSLLFICVLYVLVILVTVGVLDGTQLDQSLTPISDGALTFMGNGGWFILSIAAVLAFSSATNAGIMAASRYPLALSRDGLLPDFLSDINEKFKTPHYSILTIGVIMFLAMFLKLELLVKVASSVLILTFIFACLAVIILRESRLQNYQPSFQSPLYPWMQIVGSVGYCFFLWEMGLRTLFYCLLFIAGGLAVYWFYGRIQSTREFALLHLIERITARELTTHSLETELKEIVRERDDIMKDRFDHLIEDSMVLDIRQQITMEEFFEIASEKMAERINLPADKIYHLLMEREKESSTVLNPFLAIPHIVVEEEGVFEILLARSKEGIYFSDEYPQVHTVFVLMGSKKERPFHLRALAAICQIVQDSHFEKRWLLAKNQEQLRDIVLLSKRKRHHHPPAPIP